jgi:hypothetical protein
MHYLTKGVFGVYALQDENHEHQGGRLKEKKKKNKKKEEERKEERHKDKQEVLSKDKTNEREDKHEMRRKEKATVRHTDEKLEPSEDQTEVRHEDQKNKKQKDKKDNHDKKDKREKTYQRAPDEDEEIAKKGGRNQKEKDVKRKGACVAPSKNNQEDRAVSFPAKRVSWHPSVVDTGKDSKAHRMICSTSSTKPVRKCQEEEEEEEEEGDEEDPSSKKRKVRKPEAVVPEEEESSSKKRKVRPEEEEEPASKKRKVRTPQAVVPEEEEPASKKRKVLQPQAVVPVEKKAPCIPPTPLTEGMSAKGEEHDLQVFIENFERCAAKNPTKKVFLDMYSGEGGVGARAEAQHDLVSVPMDWLNDPGWNLHVPGVIGCLEKQVKAGRVKAGHLHTECGSWTPARHGKEGDSCPKPLRDRGANIWGFQGMSAKDQRKIELGNRDAYFTIQMVKIFLKNDVPISLENGINTMLWAAPGLKELLEEADLYTVDYCLCGRPYRKRTRLAVWAMRDKELASFRVPVDLEPGRVVGDRYQVIAYVTVMTCS